MTMTIPKLFICVGKYLFPAGRLVKLSKTVIKNSESSDPIVMAKNLTMTVLDCCSSNSGLKIAIKCTSGITLFSTLIVSPNPITFGACLNMLSEIYEDCQ